MINLFHIPSHKIDTANYQNMLHDKVVVEFEEKIAKYVGAKYACSVNSATNAIFLTFLNAKTTVTVPSMIPPVVLNALITSGNKIKFKDNIDWVGDSYILHEFDNYKIVDSAQKVEKGQFIKECNDNDLLLLSFYPTKPIGGCDGGMILSNDYKKIKWFKEATLNGMTFSNNNWERKISFPGYKMYMNSIQAEIALNNFKSYENKLLKLKQTRELYNEKLGYNNTSNHLYRIEMDGRDEFIKYAKDKGVTCGIHYEATHLNPVYSNHDSSFKLDLPKTEKNSKNTVSIPFHEKLTLTDTEMITNIIKNFTDGNR